MSHPPQTTESEALAYLQATRNAIKATDPKIASHMRVSNDVMTALYAAADESGSKQAALLCLMEFAKLEKTMHRATPPQYYPAIARQLAEEFKSNQLKASGSKKGIVVHNTVCHGAVAARIAERFPDLDDEAVLTAVMTRSHQPELHAEGIAHNLERLRTQFPDATEYPLETLRTRALKATGAHGAQEAQALSDKTLFTGVKRAFEAADHDKGAAANETGRLSEHHMQNGLLQARASIIAERQRPLKERHEGAEELDRQPSAILSMLLQSNPDSVEALKKRVDMALEDKGSRRRRVIDWESNVGARRDKNTDKDEPKR